MTTPPPKRTLPTPPPRQTSSTSVTLTQIPDSTHGHRSILYGPGGIGKSTLACYAPGPVAFVDADESLDKLKPQLKAAGAPMPMCVQARNWLELRAALQSGGWDKIKSIVLDAWSPIELWALAHTLANVKKDNNALATSLEDYGYGKGYRYVFDTCLTLMSDLDRHVRAGRNVIIVSHDETCKVPNPAGQDYIRWEPKMQHTDKASVRYRMREWADHVLFLGYDMVVTPAASDPKKARAGKAEGSGTRTLYSAERPHFMAKSRTTCAEFDVPIEMTAESSPWSAIM